MSQLQHQTESMSEIAAKAGPPVSVSIATFAGFQVSDLVLWATLIYTVLMITHKVYHFWRDVKSGKTEHGKRKD